MSGFATILLLVFIGIPTALFYGWIGGFGYAAIRAYARGASVGRWASPAAIALAPVAWYATLYGQTFVTHQQLNAAVLAAQDLPRLRNPPRTLIVHAADRQSWHDQLVEMGLFDEVYLTLTVPGDTQRLVNAARPDCPRFEDQRFYAARAGFLACATASKVDHAPTDGLHLYVGGSAPSAAGNTKWGSSILELRYNDDMIGFVAAPHAPYPVFPPLLGPTGFFTGSGLQQAPVLLFGELAFLMGRLDIDAGHLRPANLPSKEEVRDEYLRRVGSQDARDRRIARNIATATGAAALSEQDVAPVLESVSLSIGFEQFCSETNRLCDFTDRLVNQCKARMARQPASFAAKAVARCDLISKQCDWCSRTPLCRPALTGEVAGCTPEEQDSRAAFLRTLSTE